MRRAGLFFVIFGASAAALLLVLVWYLASYQGGYGSMAGLMGQMMGNQHASGTVAPMPGYVWTSFAALFVVIVVGIVGLVYYLAYPEIRMDAPRQASARRGQPQTKEDWEAVLRTSKPDERKVLEVLAAHSGAYLQKFIVKESGLSKLQTHRILSRFSERGIVNAVKSGNTNEISLAPWLMHGLPRKDLTSI